MLRLPFILAAALGLPITSFADHSQAGTAESNCINNGDFRFSLDLTYLYGPADGSLQTPSGGQPGTTSPGRPTLDELGIDDANIFDAALTLGWRHHELYAGAQLVRLSGDATLDEELISHGVTFPAGSNIDSDVQLDWYRAGYRYRFEFDTDPARQGSEFSLAPSVGVAVLAFDLQLDGTGGLETGRSYTKVSPQIGLDAEWRITRRVALVGEVLSSIPLEDVPFIFSAQIAVEYRVLDTRGVAADAVIGIGYERIQYDDSGKQDVPNDIDVDLGPLLILGLRLEF